MILFGGGLEILQGYTGRDADILDFTANSIGALAGLSVGVMFLKLLDPLVGAGSPD